MNKILKTFCLAAAAVALASCGDSVSQSNFYPEYLPFQSDEDGKWGLLGIDGKVLFADKFDKEPTEAYNGRFFVRNDDDLYEIYTAEKEPSRVGDKAYKMIMPFYEDVTPAVETGKPVTLIDKDGDIVATLDKIDGKEVTSVDAFYDGLAVFHLIDGTCGCVDTDGDVVIKPEWMYINYFNEGKFVAVKYSEEEEDGIEFVQYVLDHSGKVLFKKNLSEYNIVSPFNEGRAIVMIGNDKHNCGIIDEKGEIVLTDKKRRIITETKGDQYLCRYVGCQNELCTPDGKEIGLSGSEFHFTSQDGIIVNSSYIYDVNGEEGHHYIGTAGHYCDLHNGYFLAKHNGYMIVDKDHNRKDKDKYDDEGFYKVVAPVKTYRNKHTPQNEPTVTSDKFDVATMIEPLKIGSNGSFGGLYAGMAPYEYQSALEQLGGEHNYHDEYRVEHGGYTYVWKLHTGEGVEYTDDSDVDVAVRVELYINGTMLVENADKAKSALIDAFKKAGWKHEGALGRYDELTFGNKTMLISAGGPVKARNNKEATYSWIHINMGFTKYVIPNERYRKYLEND